MHGKQQAGNKIGELGKQEERKHRMIVVGFYRRWRLALKSSFSANWTRNGFDLSSSKTTSGIAHPCVYERTGLTIKISRTEETYAPGSVATRSMARIARSDSA